MGMKIGIFYIQFLGQTKTGSKSLMGERSRQAVTPLKAKWVSSASLPKPLIYKLFSLLTRFPSVKTSKPNDPYPVMAFAHCPHYQSSTHPWQSVANLHVSVDGLSVIFVGSQILGLRCQIVGQTVRIG